MNIQFSKYQLTWKGSTARQPREGALLRVQQPNGHFGYADCHPWFEFGDAPLDEQLHLLSKGKTSSLLNQSLQFTNIDADARARKVHLFTGLELPQNHFHISNVNQLSDALLDQLTLQGFQFIKIKMGTNLQDDCALLKTFSEKLRTNQLKLRLDFNSKLSEKDFLLFLRLNTSCLDVVDNFEDPFPYEPLVWQSIREIYKVKLASDKASLQALKHPHSCDYLVIKPAIQDATSFFTNELHERKIVITSYLDHPIGQLSGLHVAATLLKKYPQILSACGFLTHHAYEPTQFSKSFNHVESKIIPSMDGYGFGYDQLLENLNWSPLS